MLVAGSVGCSASGVTRCCVDGALSGLTVIDFVLSNPALVRITSPERRHLIARGEIPLSIHGRDLQTIRLPGLEGWKATFIFFACFLKR